MSSAKTKVFRKKARGGGSAKKIRSFAGVERGPFFPNLSRRVGSGPRFRPRISISLWLTALFLIVTAFAVGTAYAVVKPRLVETLDRASAASFGQVGQQFEALLQRNPQLNTQRISSFAVSRNVQWGIVRENGELLQGDARSWNSEVVSEAIRTEQPQQLLEQVQDRGREGQTLATWAAPIVVPGQENGTAVVFTRYYAESDDENARAALRSIDQLALLAGSLALLVAGFTGYVVADLISRRLNRLGIAARRLAAGNFDERIDSNIRDEVGSLGTTFNAMAASLKGAFRQVEQEKERGQAILDGMTDAVIGVDGELNTIFLNPRARKLLEGSNLEFQNRLQEILARARFSGFITEPEVASGDRIFEVRAVSLEEGSLAILRDVTEQRQVERAKAEFIANASHELKTPLFTLSGYLEMIEDEEDEEVRRSFLEDMRSQTERLKSLASILLDLSRLDANAVTFRKEGVDLEELLYGLRRDFQYTGRDIRIRADEELPPVETDPIQLHRMLVILLDNALKYSPEDTPINLVLSRQDGYALISVEDRGCGIPENELPHIFERFYRAQGSSRADGTGLGLALASEISHHLGGDIEVESKVDQGSTFRVELPLENGISEQDGLVRR